MPAAIMKQWNIKSQFKGLSREHGFSPVQHNAQEICGLGNYPLCTELSPVVITPTILDLWQKYCVTSNSAPISLINVHSRKNLQIKNISYTAKRKVNTGNGNHLISCLINDEVSFGEITDIYQLKNDSKSQFLVVNLFEPLSQVDRKKSPYWHYGDDRFILVYGRVGMCTMISQDDILGHVAILRNRAGTFNISSKTFVVVKLYHSEDL